jgi:hypothetical protein
MCRGVLNTRQLTLSEVRSTLRTGGEDRPGHSRKYPGTYWEFGPGGRPSPRTSSPPSQATTRPVVAAALALEASCT